jgi:dTDP-4-dehydrorhamnose 3,5-epimerase
VVEIRPLALEGVLEIVPDRHEDERGYFSETYNAQALARHGVDIVFVQDNHSLSRQSGVLRGLHFQLPPFAQAKLLRVTRGRIYDVAVDIRKKSATFGQWVGLELSAEKWNQVLVPIGYAHGFVTLEPDTEVLYKVSASYSRDHDRGIRFDDPDIDIAWPIDQDALILSDKDRAAPFLSEIETGF